MRRLTAVVVVGGMLLLAGCGRAASPENSASAGDAGLRAQSIEIDEVTVRAEPKRIDDREARIQLTFDTHTTPLAMSLPSAATLTIGGRAWRAVGWDGDGPGGHHREGLLRFLATTGTAAGPIELSVRGLSRPAIFRWTVPRE